MSTRSEWSTLFACLSKSLREKKKMKSIDFFSCACVTFGRHVKQFYSKRLELLF